MGYEIHNADARRLPLGDSSVDLIVTSPPYFGLRSYGDLDGEIGRETRLAEYQSVMREVLAEMRRVMKPSASAFIVIGDKYVSDNRGSGGDKKRQFKLAPTGDAGFVGRDAAPKGSLLGVPFRVAIDAVDMGFLWRQEIVWNKPNPTPDPAGRDRDARVHETILHLTAGRRYYADPNAPRAGDVWTVPVGSYRDPAGRKHPAVFPESLVERVVTRFAPPGGVVLDPFAGSGTTPAVAVRHGRYGIGADLNPEFAEIARDRVAREWAERSAA